jgi:hypothetical protein
VAAAKKEGQRRNPGAETTDGNIKGSRAKGIKEAAATLLPADRTLKLIGQDRRMGGKSIRPFFCKRLDSPG